MDEISGGMTPRAARAHGVVPMPESSILKSWSRGLGGCSGGRMLAR